MHPTLYILCKTTQVILALNISVSLLNLKRVDYNKIKIKYEINVLYYWNVKEIKIKYK